MLTIIGIDPGSTTGFFQVRVPNLVYHDEVLACELGAILSVALGEIAQGFDPENDAVVIACERFIITPGAKSQQGMLEAIETIGVARYLAQEHGAKFQLVTKASAIKPASNDHLRKAGWWAVGKTHANDAARIALYTLSSRAPLAYAKLIGMVQ